MKTGKLYDPVFLFMLVAVILAVASSMALRSVVGGGPNTARASDSTSDGTAPPGVAMDASATSIPAPGHKSK
ncbi:MAG: hypothetical protein ACTHN5_22500 [Phycisphaerae bacterium]